MLTAEQTVEYAKRIRELEATLNKLDSLLAQARDVIAKSEITLIVDEVEIHE